MWFKMHPWAAPVVLGVIGILYILINIGAEITSRKEKRHVSGVPFLGGIHLLIAGLVSPIKWLALLFALDYTIWMFIWVVLGIGAKKKEE